MGFDLSNYVDVAERIAMLKEKYPQAVLRPFNPAEPFKVMVIGDREFIVYTAACYRTPDDPTPAVAVAAELAVGKSSFTRDSEVMNAETSAWGRAIMAALACESTKVASMEEVRNRQADQTAPVVPMRSQPQIAAKLGKVFVVSEPPRLDKPSTGKSSQCSAKQATLIRKLAEEVIAPPALAQEIHDFFSGEITSLDEIESVTSRQASNFISHLMKLKTL